MGLRTVGYDVAIVGAGPAGAATARRLALAGHSVALLERSRFEPPRVGESLAPAVQPLLVDLGVEKHFDALAPLPSFGTRSVWGSPEAMDHSHILTPYGHGYHVDRIAFDRMLAEQAAAAGAQLLTGTRLVRCHQPDNAMWTLTLESSETQTIEVEARIVIDAAGRHSPFSRWRGARRMVFDQLVSVACGFMDGTASDQCYTLVETCEDGWWYSAPAGQNRLVGMLMTDGDLPAAAEAKDREGWMRALRRTNATRERMQSAKICWGPRVFSAISQRIIRSEFGSNWLSVGDAALAVDPISGSGVIRALRMARAAAETAIAILDCDPKAIARYEFARHDECTDYLHERIAYYQLEHRWEQSPFWQRRLRTEMSARKNGVIGLRPHFSNLVTGGFLVSGLP